MEIRQFNKLDNLKMGLSRQTHLNNDYSQLGRRLSIKQWSEASQGAPMPSKAYLDTYLTSKHADPYYNRLSSTQQFQRASNFANQYADQQSTQIKGGRAANRQF